MNNRLDQFPLFPELPEPGAQEAQDLINKFKKQMREVANNVLSDLYIDVVCFIESDSWTNFRNQMMNGFCDYGNAKIQGDYDFKKIRAQIYKDFRQDIIADLNQDLLKEVEDLKVQLKREREFNRRY